MSNKSEGTIHGITSWFFAKGKFYLDKDNHKKHTSICLTKYFVAQQARVCPMTFLFLWKHTMTQDSG